jgi:hypothetical protein
VVAGDSEPGVTNASIRTTLNLPGRSTFEPPRPRREVQTGGPPSLEATGPQETVPARREHRPLNIRRVSSAQADHSTEPILRGSLLDAAAGCRPSPLRTKFVRRRG